MSYIGNLPTNVAFVTDTFSGNGSTVAFTTSVAPASTSSILVAVTGVLQDPSTYSVSGTTLTFSAAPPSGTGNISVRYLGVPASGVTTTAYRTVTEFTATAGQTTFSVPSYTAGYIDVYRNGSRLGTADYTATNGTTVVLAAACNAGDLVVTESFYVSSVLNAIPATAGAVNSSYLASNLTLGGTTTASTGVTFSANPGGRTQATLNDYEAGTYSASFGYSSTLTSTTPTSTGTVTGTYVKVGRLVTVSFDSITQASMGNIVLFNITLPFTATAGQGYFSGYGVTGRYGGSTSTQWYPQVLTTGSSSTASLYVQIPGGGSAFPSLESGGTNITISITYIAVA